MIGWGRWSSGGCVRSLNLTLRKSCRCTTQNPFWKMRRTKFWNTNVSPNLGQTTRPSDSKKEKEKENLPNKGLCRSGSWQSENKAKREISTSTLLENFKKWNMKVSVIPMVSWALGTIPKELVKELADLEIRGQVETIQIIALLRSARILRRVLETWGDLLSLKLQWEISANTAVKNSQRTK